MQKHEECWEEDMFAAEVPPSPIQDDEFWMADGTIILVAADSVKFKVYKGALAEHSPLFAQMFTLPQPEQSSKCPVVELSDNPHDLRHVFRALMPRKNAKFITSVIPTFDAISAYVRLAHKYQIDELLEQSLTFLKSHFTSHYTTWRTHRVRVPPGFRSIHVIGVVNLARLTGCASILPTALSLCSSLGPELVRGFVRGDGVREVLSPEDLHLCLKIAPQLVQTNAAVLLGALLAPPNAPTCVRKDTCLRKVNEMLRFLSTDPLSSNARFMAPNSPFPHWNEYAEMLGQYYGVCEACLQVLGAQYTKAQGEVWKRLPEMIGIEVKDWGVYVM